MAAAAKKWSLIPLSLLFIFLVVQSIMTVLSREVPNDSGLLAANNMHDQAKYNRSTTVDSGLLVANMHETMFPSAPYYTGFDYNQWSRSGRKNYHQCSSRVHKNANFTDRIRNKQVQINQMDHLRQLIIKGGISPVQNQGSCNSCWAFAAVGAVEGRAFEHNTPFKPLAVQQLVDCVSPGRGCHKGLITTAMSWIINNGIATEEDYGEYDGLDSAMCREPQPHVKVRCFNEYNYITEDLLEALVSEGPVAAAINIHPEFYELAPDEIYYGPCSHEIDHAIVIVGYGVNEDGEKYWLIKNSWGT